MLKRLNKFTFIFLAILILPVFLSFINKTSAYTPLFAGNNSASDHILKGWAWSDTIGWISLNCENLNTCGTVPYGVAIDQATSKLSGYAWSSNIGWISFFGSDVVGCPSVVICQPTMVTSSSSSNGAYFPHIIGFAKALSASGSSSGWDGFISLSCHNDTGGCSTSNYGVTIPNSNGSGPDFGSNAYVNLSGYAWGSSVVGWVDFAKVTIYDGGSSLVLTATDSNNDPITSVPNSTTSINLNWSSPTNTAYTSCVGTGGDSGWDNSSPVPPSSSNSYNGTQSVVVPSDPTVFTIQCTTGGKTDTASVTIDINYVWDLRMTTNPGTILSGGDSRIEWFTTGNPPATLICNPDWGWTSSKDPVGFEDKTNITNSTSYAYSCASQSDPSDVKNASTIVKVLKIDFFKLDRDALCYSANDTGPTLWWAAPNADSCVITAPGGAKASVGKSGKYKFNSGGEGDYTIECSAGSGANKITVTDTLNATQCVPDYALDSMTTCSGKSGQLTDNAFQSFGGSGQYKSIINVTSTPDQGFSDQLKYSFLMPIDWSVNNWTISGWAQNGLAYESGVVNAPSYSSTFEIIAPSLASITGLLNSFPNKTYPFTINADTNPSSSNTSSATYTVCAPGGGNTKPIFIEQ